MTAATLRTALQAIVPSLTTPIVLGAMANASGGALAGKVSRAGGLGFLGAGYFTRDKLRNELDTAFTHISAPSDGRLRAPIGVGFLAWRLTALNGGEVPPANGYEGGADGGEAVALIDAALRVRPCAMWLSFGTADELARWSLVVRQRDAALNGAGAEFDPTLKLFVGVGNEEEARVAVEQCGADVLCVQGNEAGGHGLGSSPPLTAIVPAIVKRITTWRASNPSKQQPAVLAAGGIMNGMHLAAALALGADGVVVGTRMLLTPEALYSDAQKHVLLHARPGDTRRTMAFDDARGTLGWPRGVDGRGIVNETVHEFDKRAADGDEEAQKARQATYRQAEAKGDTQRIVTWAGTGAGLVDSIMPADEVIVEISRDAIAAINRLSKCL